MITLSKVEKICGYSHEELLQIVASITSAYSIFPISKGNGKKRWIKAPNEQLKTIQYSILQDMLYRVLPLDCVHGFVPERSILTNAKPHVGQKMVANFDIANFFPSTKEARVQQIFRKYYEPEESAVILLSRLCCLEGELPQGAPTSPHLANLAMGEADVKLLQYAETHNLNYTRYADDMTFSGDWTPRDIVKTVGTIIKEYGYRLAPHKIQFYGQNTRQMVTGLVVNEKIGIPRKLRKKLRAILHDMEKNGVEQALCRSDWNEDQIMGFFSLQMMWDKKEAKIQMEYFRQLLS